MLRCAVQSRSIKFAKFRAALILIALLALLAAWRDYQRCQGVTHKSVRGVISRSKEAAADASAVQSRGFVGPQLP